MSAPAPMAPSERRIVTVLFADLVGFTTLSERLDAEDVATVQSEYFRAAQEAIESGVGEVEKYIGDAVVGSFGVRHAHDDDAARAVTAGLAIVDAVARIGSEFGLEAGSLQVRVGVNTGEVVVGRPGGPAGEWRLTGDTVNVAARLQAAAKPGSVLLGADTALAAAAAFVTEPAGSLPLKGKSAPVPAWRVLRPRAVPSRQSALHGLGSVIVGRDRELGTLGELYGAGADRVTATLIVAPPGVGKTRLVDEFRQRVLDAGGTVWTARLADAAPAVAGYGFVAQLLRDATGAAARDDDDLRTTLRERLAEMGHVGPRASLSVDHAIALLRGTGLDTSPVDLWTSWTAVLDACGGAATPVWLIEDVHLAGPDERAFLAHAVAEPHRRRRMILMTARPNILGDEGPGALAGVPVMYLEPLSTEEATRLVASLTGAGVVPSAVAATVAEASGGNPLFVEEVLRTWVQGGTLRRGPAGWQFAGAAEGLEIPSTIRAIYLGQLDDLPDVPRRVVEAGSVPGSTFPSRALPVLGVDDPDPALHLLTDSGLLTGPHPNVVDPASYTYRHSLLRDTAYGVLPRAARAQLHVRFAAWVAEKLRAPVRAEIIGEHLATAYELAPALGGFFEHSMTRDELRVRAAQWLERAAEISMAAAPQRAIQLLERALDLTEDGEEKLAAQRRLRLAEALRRSARLEVAMRAFAAAGELAERRHDPAAAGAAALGYEDALFESRLPRGEWGPAGLRLLAQALERTGGNDALRSRLLAAQGRAQVYAGLSEAGVESCDRALDLARRSSDDGAHAYALLSMRAAQSGPEHLGARLSGAGELVEAAARAGDAESELEGARLHFVDLVEAGDLNAARAAQQRAEALIDRLRRPLFLWYPAMWRAMMALFGGDLDDAAALIAEFREEGQRWRYRDFDLVHTIQALQLHIDLGTPGEALPALHRVASTWPDRFSVIEAAARARAGDTDAAREHLAQHRGQNFANVAQDLSRSYTLAQAVDATALIGDSTAAAQLRGLLGPWRGHTIVLGSGALCLGAASHYLGVAARTAGDADAAIADLWDAVRMNDEMSAIPAATRSRLELARTLTQLGRRDDARPLAMEGQAAARRTGMAGVVDDFTRLLGEDAGS